MPKNHQKNKNKTPLNITLWDIKAEGFGKERVKTVFSFALFIYGFVQCHWKLVLWRIKISMRLFVNADQYFDNFHEI